MSSWAVKWHMVKTDMISRLANVSSIDSMTLRQHFFNFNDRSKMKFESIESTAGKESYQGQRAVSIRIKVFEKIRTFKFKNFEF